MTLLNGAVCKIKWTSFDVSTGCSNQIPEKTFYVVDY